MSPLAAAALAGGLVAGLMLAVAGLVGLRGPARPPSRLAEVARRALGLRLPPAVARRRRAYAIAATAALSVTWLHTGIPTAGIIAGTAVCAIPWLFGGARAESRAAARLEAIEVWTRRLADLVRSGAGLHQAILTSAAEPPVALAEELALLAADLRGDAPTTAALHTFADRLADATADEVIAALMLNAHHRGQRLADVLTGIGDGIGDLVTMRREVASSRSDARISAYVLACLALGGLALLFANTSYMAPFHSGHGQAVLAACAALIAGCLAWTRRLNAPPRVPRLLTPRSPHRDTRARVEHDQQPSVPRWSDRGGAPRGTPVSASAEIPILLGAGLGTGLYLVVRGLAAAPPALRPALERLRPTPGQAHPGRSRRARPGGSGEPLWTAHGRMGNQILRWMRPPSAQLRLLGQSTQRYAIEKIAYTLGGLVAPDAVALGLRDAGVGVPLLVPTVAGLLAAAGMFFLADVNIAQRAAAAREEFRRSIAAYLTLVGLVRYSGAGAVESLEAAAGIGGGWVFERIREALDDARYANEAPWERLRRAAAEIGVADLGDVGDIMSLAGEAGAQVYQTLIARAQSLRVALRTRAQAKAAAATTLMYVPTVMLLFSFLILIGYPAYSRIAG